MDFYGPGGDKVQAFFTASLNRREADVDDRPISNGQVHDSALTGLITRQFTLAVRTPWANSRIKTQIDLGTHLLTNKLFHDIPFELRQSLEISDFQHPFQASRRGGCHLNSAKSVMPTSLRATKLALAGIIVSHESIYKYVLKDRKGGGLLWKQLRINGTRRYRCRNKVGRGEKIKNRVDIEKRPSEAAERSRYGDWEADLIQGAGASGYLLSLYERKSRVGKLYKLGCKESGEVAVAMIMTLKEFDVKTITYDNGLEFAKHEFGNDLLGSESYFCKPYSSWEKGGVENYNGLIRQYFPKGSDFTGITLERLQEVEDEVNNRPRNILNYETPNDLVDHLKAS